MTLHEHYQPRSTDTLVVFVHGLSGKGYETWGGFPKLVFESQGSTVVDVGVFDYFSGKRRIFRVRPRAHLVADSLAQCIAEIQSKYTEIFLVGHSMGGLISKDAARIYLEKYDSDRTLLKRLSGIVLLGCPQRGSRWAVPFFTPLVIEIKYLRNGSKYQRRIRKFFKENIDETDLPQKGNRDFMIATYAASGDQDFVVTRNSAIADVFPRQCNNFRANHRSLVKPTQVDHPQVTWLLNIIAKVSLNRSKVRAQLSRERFENAEDAGRPRARTMLITELMPPKRSWRDAYLEVVAGASSPFVEVVDRQAANAESHVLVSVNHAKDVTDKDADTIAAIQKAAKVYSRGETEVRLVSMGPERDAAVAQISTTITPCGPPSPPPWLLVHGAADIEQFKTLLATYIESTRVMIERGLKWARYQGGAEIHSYGDETPLVDYGEFI